MNTLSFINKIYKNTILPKYKCTTVEHLDLTRQLQLNVQRRDAKSLQNDANILTSNFSKSFTFLQDHQHIYEMRTSKFGIESELKNCPQTISILYCLVDSY